MGTCSPYHSFVVLVVKITVKKCVFMEKIERMIRFFIHLSLFPTLIQLSQHFMTNKVELFRLFDVNSRFVTYIKLSNQMRHHPRMLWF